MRRLDTKTSLFLDQQMCAYTYACIQRMSQWYIETLIHWDIKTPIFMVQNYASAYTSIIQMRRWDTKTPLFLDQKSCVYACTCIQGIRQWDIETLRCLFSWFK